MKKILFILLLAVVGCGKSANNSSDTSEKPPLYKKGDVVCVIEFHNKGIVQYENFNFSGNEPVYDVMFVDNYNHIYDVNIYESQLEQCP